MTRKKLLVFDAMNMFIRNYIVDPSLAIQGHPIGGTKGFMKSMQKVIRQVKPDEIIICWDGDGGSRRKRQANKNYKAGRKPARLNRSTRNLTEQQELENKIWQQLRIVEYLNQMPVVQLMLSDIEADDIIAYVVQDAYYDDWNKIIVSMDKDFLQLMDDSTILLRPIKDQLVTKKTVIEEYGIHPRNFALARAMAGDKSDNLEGVKGVGLGIVKKRFPFMEEDRDVFINEIVEHCQSQKKKLVAHERIINSMDKIINNYKIMQLYSPNISSNAAQTIRHQCQQAQKFYNKSNILAMMMQDGIVDYNWTELWTCFRNICWGGKCAD